MSERKHTDREISDMFEEYAKTKDKKLRDKLVEEHLYLAEILAKNTSAKVSTTTISIKSHRSASSLPSNASIPRAAIASRVMSHPPSSEKSNAISEIAAG